MSRTDGPALGSESAFLSAPVSARRPVMKLCSLLFTTVIVATFAGCCGTNACVNSCDPCGRELAGGGCPLKRLLKHRCDKCHPMATYGWEGAGCGTCQGYPPGMCEAPTQAMNCSCGQPHHPAAPAMAPIPGPPPAPATAPAPAPPAYEQGSPMAPPAPAPKEETTAIPASAAAATAPRQVSYEEFHRLPGVVISGPTPVTPAPPVLTPPQTATPAATWVPTR